MTAKQFNIFLAAYFSDAEQIQKLIQSESDSDLYIEVPEHYTHWKQREVPVSVIDILIMTRDCWYNLRNEKELKLKPGIHPDKIYAAACNLIDWFAAKYPHLLKHEFAYEKLSKFLYVMDDDVNWIDEEEFAKYVKEGYRPIDLQLINFAVKRNLNKVKDLLHMGANPMTDPDEKTFKSGILENLSSGDSYHFSDYQSYHWKLLHSGINSFDAKDVYDMITFLYCTASSSRLYREIEEYCIINGLNLL